MGRFLYLYINICRRHILRIIVLCLVVVMTGLVLLHLSALISTFEAYRKPFKTLYYDKNMVECMSADFMNEKISAKEMINELEKIDGIRIYSQVSTFSEVRHKGVRVDLLIIDDEFWRGFSELPRGTGFSETGLSTDGKLQAMIMDPFGLVRGRSVDFSFGGIAVPVEVTARFTRPYLFPSVNRFSSSGALSFFEGNKIWLVLKKSDAVVNKLNSYDIATSDDFSQIFFLEYIDGGKAVSDRVNEMLETNQYIKLVFRDDALLDIDSSNTVSKETILLAGFLVFVIIIFSLGFLIIFYYFNADEFTKLRLAGMRDSYAAMLALATSLSPFILSLAADMVFYIVFSSIGKPPLMFIETGFNGSAIYSLPIYLQFLGAFAGFYFVISALTLLTTFKRGSVLVSVKEKNVWG